MTVFDSFSSPRPATSRAPALLLSAVALMALSACSSDETTAPESSADVLDSDAVDSDAVDSDAVGSGDANTTEQDARVDTAEPDASAPADPLNEKPAGEPGPWGVGYKSVEVVYTPEWTDEPRTIRVAMWYPTDASGDPPTYVGIIPRTGVVLDAAPVSIEDQPVLLYSHGNFGFAEASFFLTEHFASHGWLVLAPDHTGNTFTDFSVERSTATYLTRASDLSACLDELAPTAQRIAVSGHSFGGYTALSITGATHAVDRCDGTDTSDFCTPMTAEQRAAFPGLVDARIDLAIPMSGGNADELGPGGAVGSGAAAIEVPVLLMTASMDNQVTNADNGDPYWAALNGAEDRRLDLTDGGHQSWAVTCEYFGSLMPGDGCEGEEFIDPMAAWTVTNRYALAFARYHLTGDRSETALLDGTETFGDTTVFTLP